MSKLEEIIKALAANKKEISVLLPGGGPTLSTVESLDDDVVTLAPKDQPKLILHYTQFVVQRD